MQGKNVNFLKKFSLPPFFTFKNAQKGYKKSGSPWAEYLSLIGFINL